jgi:hypothetical protein
LKPFQEFFPIYKFPSVNGKAEKVGEIEVKIKMEHPNQMQNIEPEKVKMPKSIHHNDIESKKKELLETMNEAKQFLIDQEIGKNNDSSPLEKIDNMDTEPFEPNFLINSNSKSNKSLPLEQKIVESGKKKEEGTLFWKLFLNKR